MRSKRSQLDYLGQVLHKLESGLYLLDTELDEKDMECYFNQMGGYSFHKEELIPAVGGSPFELLVIALCRQFECEELNRQRCLILGSRGSQKENLIYDTLISVVKNLNSGKPVILLLYGELDISSFKHEELAKLKYSVSHHGGRTIILSMLRNENNKEFDKLITQINLNYSCNMEDRKRIVHITYKHDDAHRSGIDAIKMGLDTHMIPYSIDEYDIKYRDNIQKYEDEIGASDIVIMFVIPEYLRSLDCMYEMTQLYKNGNVSQRVFPVVDLGNVQRNGDGLAEIRKYWQGEHLRTMGLHSDCSGRSNSLLGELGKLNDILNTLDDFWDYIVHTNTGKYEDVIANNAELLVTEIEKHLKTSSSVDNGGFTPSYATEPEAGRRIINQGEKSVYVVNNVGTINIR